MKKPWEILTECEEGVLVRTAWLKQGSYETTFLPMEVDEWAVFDTYRTRQAAEAGHKRVVGLINWCAEVIGSWFI